MVTFLTLFIVANQLLRNAAPALLPAAFRGCRYFVRYPGARAGL